MALRRRLVAWATPLALLPAAAAFPHLATAAAAAVPDATASGTYHAVTPSRILDTRSGLGAAQRRVGQGGIVRLQVSGAGGVPASGVGAVVLNVTVANADSGGYLTAYADGSNRPGTSNLNFTAHNDVANLVTVPVGANGVVDLYNSAGSTDLVADVNGWFAAGTPSAAGAFRPLTPTRLLDTRSASAVSGRSSVRVPVVGRAGIPGNVSAVTLNVTVTEPQATGYLTAYPDGSPVPLASNVNFVGGQTVPNSVTVPVGPDGAVAVFNGSYTGSAHVVVDVYGYYLAGTPTLPGTFQPVTPSRLLDTRDGTGTDCACSVAPHGTVHLPRPNDNAGALALNVTVTEPQQPGYVAAAPVDVVVPTVSNVNFGAGMTVPNQVDSMTSSDGINLYNGSSGDTQLVADLAGYYLADPAQTQSAPTGVSGPVVRPEQFGARGNGVADDTAALQQAFDKANGRTVQLTAGRTYPHSAVLHLRTAGLHVTGAATLLAINEQYSSVWLEADNVQLDGGVDLKVANTTKRWDAYEQMGLRIAGHTGITVRNVTVEGSAAAGVYVGNAATRYTLDTVTVKNTRADGIHQTNGVSYGTVVNPTVVNSGDDGVAVVSYSQDGPSCHDISITNPRVLGTAWGRGISVVGGQNISYRNVHVERSNAAAIYIAAEGDPYYTNAPVNVTVSGGTIIGANTNAQVDHGAVLVMSAENKVTPTNVTIADLAISNTRSNASRNIGVISYGLTPANVLFSNVAISGGPQWAYGGNVPAGSYRLVNVTKDGLRVTG